MDFNAQQLLFEAFLDITQIFGSGEAQSEYTLPFLYIIMFQSIFGAPSSTPGGIKHMHPVTFFVWNSMLNNFYFKHFWIFLSVSRPIVNLLCHFCILMFTFFACFKDCGHWLHFDMEVTYLGLV